LVGPEFQVFDNELSIGVRRGVVAKVPHVDEDIRQRHNGRMDDQNVQ
jgi:hypothetical protein